MSVTIHAEKGQKLLVFGPSTFSIGDEKFEIPEGVGVFQVPCDLNWIYPQFGRQHIEQLYALAIAKGWDANPVQFDSMPEQSPATQLPPIVHVHVPEQPVPIVNVTPKIEVVLPHERTVTRKVNRDVMGRIDSVTERTKYE